MVKIHISLDVHKRNVYITEMEENGDVKEQYEIANSEESLESFRPHYNGSGPEIALEVSTTGKYVARKLNVSIPVENFLKTPK